MWWDNFDEVTSTINLLFANDQALMMFSEKNMQIVAHLLAKIMKKFIVEVSVEKER